MAALASGGDARHNRTMHPAAWLLSPFSLLYGAVIHARNAYYDRWPGAIHRAAVPVISVGNITVGGTGKTPMVIEIVRRLLSMGRRPGILTRGYKAQPGEKADEVLEFESSLPGVPVVVEPDRVAGAETAVREHGVDCLILDDGFQHRRLGRDLDVVLIDALNPWGGGLTLPAGRLREPRAALRRAEIVIITRANQVEPTRLNEIKQRVLAIHPATPFGTADVQPVGLTGARGAATKLDQVTGKQVLTVCGVGNPQTFQRSVAGLEPATCWHRVFADHHHYDADTAQRLSEDAASGGADLVVTTRKDWVKLASCWPADAVPLVRLDIELRISSGGELLDERLRLALESQ